MKPIQLGRMTVHKIHEIDVALPIQLPLPDITPGHLARLAEWFHDPQHITGDPATSQVDLSNHSWVVELDGQTILIDGCNGNHKHRSLPFADRLDTRYLDNLRAAGFAPEDIDLVLCTHLHSDHVGWNTRLENGRWVPTFPRARYLFGRRDFEYLRNCRPGEDFSHEAFLDSIVPVMEAGRGELVDEDSAVHREIGNGVWLEPAFGHSAGSCTINAEAGGAPALFWGDVVHHPAMLVCPQLLCNFDHDRETARAVRLALLDRVADSGTMCFPAHFRGCSAGEVLRDGDAYRYRFAQ